MSSPRVSIIILNWNGKADTLACIESIKAVRYDNYEIILVDNGSTDGSAEAFKKECPHVKLLETGKNLGYAEGNNVGIRLAMKEGADHLCLLNNDTVVEPSFLTELVKVAESDERIGIVGPKMFYFEPKDMLYYAGGRINWLAGSSGHDGYQKKDAPEYNKVKDTGFVNGACLLVKRKVVGEIGGLPADYFLMWEDTDFCVNAARHGYRVVYAPSAVIWHKISASIKKMKAATMYYGRRGNVIFIRKYARGLSRLTSLIWLIFIYGTISSAYYALKYRSFEILTYSVKGILEGLKYDLKKPIIAGHL